MNPRRVVALVGLPGSGKTSLTGPLVARHGFSLIDRDAIRTKLFPDCAFTQAEKQAANQAVLEALRVNCAAGRESLLDGMTFGRRSEREVVGAIASRHGFRFIALWLDCPVEVAVRRVTTQPHAAADRSPALVREVAARFERPDEAVRLDATRPLDELRCLIEAVLT
ncbi:MAG: AAA family ATPase [Bacillota bacterium]